MKSALDMANREHSVERSNDARVFLALLLSFYFLILEPILRANRYYNDDLKRSLIGRTGWDSNGRPLTTLLMRVLQCYDHALVDISPLTQIGAIAILAYIGMLIARKYVVGSPAVATLVALPLGAQPFFLENLSYKFDALSMSVAMLLSLLPVLVLKCERRDFWLGILALFTALNFYQPAINVYLVFVVLDVALNSLEKTPPRQLFRNVVWRAAQTAIAMMLYEAIVGIHVNGGVKHKSESIHNLSQLHLIGKNLFDVLDFIGDSFNEHWWLYLGPGLIALAIFPVVTAILYWRDSQSNDRAWIVTGAALLCLSLPVIALMCIAGPMLVLVDPPIVPRVLLGVGALLAAGLIFMHCALRRWNFSQAGSLFLGSAFAIGMATIASAYGNASGEQRAFEDRIGARIADDLADVARNRTLHSYLIVGATGYAPVTAHIIDQLPIVQALIPTYLAGDDTFHTHVFLAYYIQGLQDLGDKPDVATQGRIADITAQRECALHIRSAASYEITIVENVAVITLHALTLTSDK